MSSNSRTSRLLMILLLALAAALLAVGCGGSDGDDSDGGSSSDDSAESSSDVDECDPGGSSDEVAARNESIDAAPSEKLDPAKTYKVRVETNKGEFTIDVDQKAGPRAAANFVYLVGEGFYDGIIFHRIIKDFMIQTGDPLGVGTGGPGYAIEDDPVKQPYKVGTVAMANSGPDTGGSQFFIVTGEQGVGLPPNYVIFGQVDEAGMKVIKKIESTPVEASDMGEESSPCEEIRIEKAELVEA